MRRGWRVAGGLIRRLGIRAFLGILLTYLHIQIARGSARLKIAEDGRSAEDSERGGVSAAATHQSAGLSRRALLRLGATAPVLGVVTKLAHDPSIGGTSQPAFRTLNVHVARVDSGSEGFSVAVERAPQVATIQPQRKSGIPLREYRTVRDSAIFQGSLRGDETRAFTAFDRSFTASAEHDGRILLAAMDLAQAHLSAPRYDLGLNLGFGYAEGESETTSSAGLLRHDVAGAFVDVVKWSPAASHRPFPTHVASYAEALRELAAVHRSEGEVRLAQAYELIVPDLLALADALPTTEQFMRTPTRDVLVITALPELLSWLPREIVGQSAGCFIICCECGCECGGCNFGCSFGCGCTAGACASIPPGLCGCGYCCGVGIGCGCGCCCDRIEIDLPG